MPEYNIEVGKHYHSTFCHVPIEVKVLEIIANSEPKADSDDLICLVADVGTHREHLRRMSELKEIPDVGS